jgi:hypothetical protein
MVSITSRYGAGPNRVTDSVTCGAAGGRTYARVTGVPGGRYDTITPATHSQIIAHGVPGARLAILQLVEDAELDGDRLHSPEPDPRTATSANCAETPPRT